MGGGEPQFSFRNNFLPPKNEPRVPLSEVPTGRQEFGLFPWEGFRDVPDYIRAADPGRNKISPWARRDSWKWHPFFSLKNRFRHFIPGLEVRSSASCLAIFYFFILYSLLAGCTLSGFQNSLFSDRGKFVLPLENEASKGLSPLFDKGLKLVATHSSGFPPFI